MADFTPADLPPGLCRIERLDEVPPWPMGLAGLAKWLTWETENVLGKSKSALIRQVASTAVGHAGGDGLHPEIIVRAIEEEIRAEQHAAEASGPFDRPVSGKFIAPVEAQRRMRVFAEDYLNREFDIFAALLPDHRLHAWFREFFDLPDGGKWHVSGNTNDFELSTGIAFMQMDTIAYNPEIAELVAVELKIDAALGERQILNYAFMVAALEQRHAIAEESRLNLLILAADETAIRPAKELRTRAREQLATGDVPSKRLSSREAAKLAERAAVVLDEMDIATTTWQAAGDYWLDVRDSAADNARDETLVKLIDGFVWGLSQKFSRALNRPLYVPAKPR